MIRASIAPAPVARPQIPAPAAPKSAAVVTTAVPVVMVPRGATRLMLTPNAFSIDAQNGDPFAKLEAKAQFKTSDELGWVAQYCGESEQQLSVPFMVRITGGPASQPVDMATPMEEVAPDRIQASPGCYLMRGAIPLDDLTAGKYTLHLMIDDPIVKSDTYELKQEFAIE